MISAGHLKIGPLCWNLRVPAGCRVHYPDPAYRGFWTACDPSDAESPASSSVAGIRTMPVSVQRKALAIPVTEPMYRAGLNWAIWEDGPDCVICSGFHGRERARVYCRLSHALDHAVLNLDPEGVGTDSAMWSAPLRYPLDQILSWALLSRCGGLVLHSALAVKDGLGWVFAGRSGAGKSTLSALCHARGWRILNDDRAMVFHRDGRLRVSGTPWHGSGRFAEADEVPLGGIYFLHQALQNRVEPMTESSVRLALLDVAGIPWFEDAWAQGALDAVERIARTADVAACYFTNTLSVVDVLESHRLEGVGVCA